LYKASILKRHPHGLLVTYLSYEARYILQVGELLLELILSDFKFEADSSNGRPLNYSLRNKSGISRVGEEVVRQKGLASGKLLLPLPAQPWHRWHENPPVAKEPATGEGGRRSTQERTAYAPST
jgi:hypothetical protein